MTSQGRPRPEAPPGAAGGAGGGAAPRGRLRLRFRRDPAGATYLAEQRAGYPFHLCRPHRYDGDPDGMATLYVQSVAGGLYDGDDLVLGATVERGAAVHLTTQAATIVHATPTAPARHGATLSAGTEGFVEYLPDATILFPAARLDAGLSITADDGAVVVAGDSFLTHDPEGRGRAFGWIRGAVEVRRRDGRLLFADRYQLAGEDWARRLPGVSAGRGGQGMLLVLHPGLAPEALVEGLRAALHGQSDLYAGASTLPNGCGAWARLLAPDGAPLRAGLLAAWSAVRTLITGVPPRPRRK
ncbi:MAG: urease accessory protein UreD [Rhodospirillaceae bacterium]|nr:urease accessory protein UreD [Rhodospirillaceae bacterium]